MDYSRSMLLKNNLVNDNKEIAPTKINQHEKHKVEKQFRCSSTDNLWIIFKDCPVGFSMQKAIILALDMELSKFGAKKSREEKQKRKRSLV